TIYVTHDQEEAMVLSDEIAVMHEGRVLQMGRPETLYTRPANRTVAAFFGAPNLLDAKAVLAGARPPAPVLLALGGARRKGWCRGPIGFEIGGAVTVVVRPEVIRFRGPEGKEPRPGISWCGLIRQRVFRGARTLYIVDVAGRRLSVDAPPGALTRRRGHPRR